LEAQAAAYVRAEEEASEREKVFNNVVGFVISVLVGLVTLVGLVWFGFVETTRPVWLTLVALAIVLLPFLLILAGKVFNGKSD
jgi:membrane protein YdbS with pleckstrin-like domain